MGGEGGRVLRFAKAGGPFHFGRVSLADFSLEGGGATARTDKDHVTSVYYARAERLHYHCAGRYAHPCFVRASVELTEMSKREEEQEGTTSMEKLRRHGRTDQSACVLCMCVREVTYFHGTARSFVSHIQFSARAQAKKLEGNIGAEYSDLRTSW